MTPDKVEAALASLGIDAALVDEGLSYFHGSGDDGDKLYVSEIRKALSVLTEALAERGWRPIESAPKSLQEIFELYPDGFGTTVLIARCDEAIPGELAVISGCVAEATLLEDGRWASPMPPGFPNTGDGWIEIVNPTHWKPMPSQPAMKETP